MYIFSSIKNKIVGHRIQTSVNDTHDWYRRIRVATFKIRGAHFVLKLECAAAIYADLHFDFLSTGLQQRQRCFRIRAETLHGESTSVSILSAPYIVYFIWHVNSQVDSFGCPLQNRQLFCSVDFAKCVWISYDPNFDSQAFLLILTACADDKQRSWVHNDL